MGKRCKNIVLIPNLLLLLMFLESFQPLRVGSLFVFYSVFSMYCLEKLEKYLAVFTGNYTYAGMLFGLLSVDKKLI